MSEIDSGGPEGVLVDHEDVPIFSAYKWRITNNGYAVARVNKEKVLLHRFLMGAKSGQEVHHKNLNRLDCRKENLEITTAKEHQNYHKHLLIARNQAGRIYPKERPCGHCGVVFSVDVDHRGRNRFCSLSCSSKSTSPIRVQRRKATAMIRAGKGEK